MAKWKDEGSRPLRGGSLDLSLDGELQLRPGTGVWIELPLQVQLRDTQLRVPGMKETRVDSLALPLGRLLH